MDTPLVSIIIPCYNAAPYIRRCIDSIARQTYRNIEALFVDDCGSDNTVDILYDYINTYKGNIQFRIIHQDCNQGVSITRNRGLKEAKGEYILFLDSDDSITEKCIETLIGPILADKSIEMVIGNYKIIGPLYFAPFLQKEGLYNSDETIEAQFTYKFYGMPWNKIIKKDFLIKNNLYFVEGIIHEDVLWNYYCALFLNKVYVVLTRTYNYYVHAGSITTTNTKLHHQEQMLTALMHLINYIHNIQQSGKKDVRKNVIVYKHIDHELQIQIIDPIFEGNKIVSKQRYYMLRDNCCWDFMSIMTMKGLRFHERIKHLHWFIPKSLGYRYYIKNNKKRNIKQQEIFQMKLTVITINYNNLSGLQRTIPSIVSQTYTGFEFIVVDGGSTDGSKEYIASQERIDNWVSEPDNGVYHAMNKAVQMAHGEYCIFMNSGDTFFSAQVLEQCIYRLRNFDYICGRSVYMEQDNAYPFIPPKEINLDFLFVNALCHQSLFTKTAVLKKYPFNEEHRIVSDWEQYFKAWFIHGCTFASLDIFVSIFYLDGISGTNKTLDAKERDETIRTIIAESDDKGKFLHKRYESFLGKIRKEEQLQTDSAIECNYTMTHKRIKRKENVEKLKNKIETALTKKSPFHRDLNVIRYGLKYLFKDLFI